MKNDNSINNNKLIAIYSRKSKYTGIGESIDNQIEMCKNYLINKYGQKITNNIKIYEDEGFTGANTNRPQFQKMLTEFQKGNYCMLIVYRLDRISRNVLDFCSLKDQLSNWNIDFISITENFDTSTPMGTAMLMITSVFAQLERDTIAERIKDNMYELAKTGRWLGGTTPLGYTSKKIEHISIDGKKRSLYQLTFDEEEIEKVKLIFDKYKELKSLSKLEGYLIQNNIKTRNGIYFSRFALSNILKNLVYCKADQDIKNFLKSKTVEIFENGSKFDGKCGLISYNKRIKKKSRNGKTRNDQIKDITDWIVSIGKHEGILNGKDWINIWEIMEKKAQNKRIIKTNSKIESILSGILRCKNCNSFMRPKVLKTYDEKGKRNFMYICELKSKSRKQCCHVKNIRGIETDQKVLEKLKAIKPLNSEVVKLLKTMMREKFNKKNNDSEIKTLNILLNSNKKKIKGLLEKLALLDSELTLMVTNEIKILTEKNVEIEKKLNKLSKKVVKNKNELNINNLALDIINNYINTFYELDVENKRSMIKLLISSIIYNSEIITINLINTDHNITQTTTTG